MGPAQSKNVGGKGQPSARVTLFVLPPEHQGSWSTDSAMTRVFDREESRHHAATVARTMVKWRRCVTELRQDSAQLVAQARRIPVRVKAVGLSKVIITRSPRKEPYPNVSLEHCETKRRYGRSPDPVRLPTNGSVTLKKMKKKRGPFYTRVFLSGDMAGVAEHNELAGGRKQDLHVHFCSLQFQWQAKCRRTFSYGKA